MKEVQTLVASAFPGTGKSYLFKTVKDKTILDSDSSNFSWVIEKGEKKRNPDFPANYISHIKENIGKADIIMVSSHEEVRNALNDANINYSLFYPNITLKDEYITRYKERGNEEAFINLINNNWDEWITDLNNTESDNVQKIVMQSGEYLSDYIV